ncbi:fatty acid synthase-like [Condylostylus longicornis]|uniref:fatty acid synthase-like n=1 Tax=Condylostylus longicornis TaxID=2530218 RepID=UPI00244DD8D6|nr:fatty acid synthase-like [Condylostylus longicornis]
MMANRISYCLGLNGPSYLVDSGSNSSLQCLTAAYNSLRNGEIDAAIVGGANIILFPYIDLHFKNLGAISEDGITRPFDQFSSGYNRSETVASVLLQRKRDAKRIYGQLIHARCNYDGYKSDGIAQFSTTAKKELLNEFYNEIKFNPSELGYIEANANGVPNEDISECEIIDTTLSKYRKEPLMIGSVKSNIGHTDAASGIAAIVKCCLALKNKKVPPNLNFTEPRKEIVSIRDGRLKVVKEIEPLKAPYIGVNSYSLTGENSHALFKAYEKPKVNKGLPEDNLPRIINWCGRTEEGVENVFRELEGKPLDAEYIALLHEISSTSISGYLFRGYGLLAKDQNNNGKILVKDVQHHSGLQRPVVWVFSGMGSQWTGMGTALMEIPVIRQSLIRCSKALEPKGLNLIDILTSKDPKTYDNILHSFVGIAAIQIALVDLLKSLNLEPDYIIGHSVGELGCGYADGGFTPEQMILCSYSRGKVSLETEKIVGSMAAVGLGYKQIINILPSTIEVACHNSHESSTISGPAEEITKFVNQLKSKNIFAKEVPCSNIAYHSKYIAKMGPNLLKYLKQIIPDPKLRSKKWLCSSVPENSWNSPEVQFCSAEYHTNNLLNSVLFEETANLLPKDALCIEIAPHGLLQAILKRSMPNAIHIGLTQRGNENNHHFLLQSLGKIFLNGVDMPVQNIYPKVDFPVSNGTKSISPLVSWDHTDNWFVTEVSEDKITNERTLKISLQKEEYKFLYGYKIDNRVVVPPMFLVQIVADFYVFLHKANLMETGIQFDNIKIKKYLFLTESDEIDLHLMIHPGSGHFAITQNEIAVIEGRISMLLGTDEITNISKTVNRSTTPNLSSDDFYKELQLRGQEYTGIFRSVIEARGDGSKGKVKWNGFYFSFLESLVQTAMICTDTRDPMLVSNIRELKLFGKQHLDALITNEIFCFENSKIYKKIVSGGVEISGLETKHISRKQITFEPNLSINQFIPNFPSPLLSISDAVRCCIQTATENFSLSDGKMKVVEFINENHDAEPLVKYFVEEFENAVKVNGQCFLITDQDVSLPKVQIEEGSICNHINCSFIVLTNALDNVSLADEAAKSLLDGAFMISRETLRGNIRTKKLPIGFNCVAILNTAEEILILLKKVKRVKTSGDTIAIKVSEFDPSWISNVKNMEDKAKIVLYTENEKYTGILGMVNCLKDLNGHANIVSFVFIEDKNAPKFSLNNDFYRRQIDLGLTVNIFKDGQWGSYKDLNLKDISLNINNFYADIDQPGNLESLKWYQKNNYRHENIIEVLFATINSRDIALATGRIPKDMYGKNRKDHASLFGVEYSGVDLASKKRVMGIANKNALSSYIEYSNSKCIWNIPTHWTLEEAATVPYVYTMVYYAYFHIIKIEKGFSILIHEGASDLGIAAIRIAIASGLNVFTTVRNEEQKTFLLNMFQDFKKEQISSCLDIDFEEMIQDKLDYGVNYVLNTLSGEGMLTSLRCLSKQGHMLQFDRYDISENNTFGMGDFLKEITLHTISIEKFLSESDEKILKIHNLIQADIDNGIVIPLPLKCFDAAELKEAFTLAAKLEHHCKIVFNMKHQSINNIIGQVYFDPDLSYIVCDDLKVFGVEFIDWMIMRGAKNILLHSKEQNDFQANKIAIWKTYGVNLLLSYEDITTKKGCLSLLESSKKLLGPVGGIFNLNNFNVDKKFTWELAEEHINELIPQINKIKFLDELSSSSCPKLKYFVIVTNYCNDSIDKLTNSMLCSIYEQLVENRNARNLPAKILTFGAVEHESTNVDGCITQPIRSCLNTLDKLLLTNCNKTRSLIVDKVENFDLKGNQSNVYDEILNLTGISDEIIITNERKNLSDIGINPFIAIQIQKLLDEKLNLNLSFTELNKMNLQKIKSLTSTERKSIVHQTKLKLSNDRKVKGVSALLADFREIPINAETLVEIPNKSIEKATPIIVIPGIEGIVSSVWYNAVKNWNSYPIALQFNTIKSVKSIEEIVQSIFKDIRHVLRKTTKFFFVAYSFGSMLAIELASMLEKHNYKGKILIIDGAPHFMKQLLKNTDNSEMSDAEIFDQVLSIILSQFDNQPLDKLLTEFSNIVTYNEKLNRFKDYIKLQSNYAEEYALNAVQDAFNRIQMIKKYKGLNNKINCPIMLVKPKEVSIIDIEEDYNLSAITTSTVEIKYLQSNHFTIMENEELGNLINDFNPNRDEQQNFQEFLTSGRKFETDNN